LSILGKVVTKTGSDDSDADVAILPLLLPNPNQADGSYTPDQLTAISISNYNGYFACIPTIDGSIPNPCSPSYRIRVHPGHDATG
jgi:hypothetical protein